jgi:hypothetical protein
MQLVVAVLVFWCSVVPLGHETGHRSFLRLLRRLPHAPLRWYILTMIESKECLLCVD